MTIIKADTFFEQLSASDKNLIFINFWATWCGPCKEEFPYLIKLEEEYRDRDIAFWAVSCDMDDALTTLAPQFLKEMTPS